MGEDKVDICRHSLLPRRGEVMPWSYRIRKRIVEGLEWYDVVEYYDGHDRWTEDSMAPGGETRADCIKCLEMMLADAKRHYTVIEEEKP